ncbi:hypothetical protein [Paraburkholderia piptadeniae]|uniref:hypothetical protein n=1 Tax=Paraburkholderia piptadeniae TaxID=1701573 RepID=UPI00135AD7C4|nr:hypothetical protein [Paraburkholderia piptadeniae]
MKVYQCAHAGRRYAATHHKRDMETQRSKATAYSAICHAATTMLQSATLQSGLSEPSKMLLCSLKRFKAALPIRCYKPYASLKRDNDINAQRLSYSGFKTIALLSNSVA